MFKFKMGTKERLETEHQRGWKYGTNLVTKGNANSVDLTLDACQHNKVYWWLLREFLLLILKAQPGGGGAGL